MALDGTGPPVYLESKPAKWGVDRVGRPSLGFHDKWW